MTASSLANLETKVKAEKGYRSDSASHVQTGMPGFVCPRADAYGGRDGVIPPGIAAQRGLVPRGMREVTLAEASASSQAIRALREKGVTDSDIYREYYGRGLAEQHVQNVKNVKNVKNARQSAQRPIAAHPAPIRRPALTARPVGLTVPTAPNAPTAVLSKRELEEELNLCTLNQQNNQTQTAVTQKTNTQTKKSSTSPAHTYTQNTKKRLNKKAKKALNERNELNELNTPNDNDTTSTTQQEDIITQLKQEIIAGLKDTLIAQLTQGHNAVAQATQVYAEEDSSQDYYTEATRYEQETFENTEENAENNKNTHARLFSEENNRHYGENSLDAFYDTLKGTKLGMREGTEEENESLFAARGDYRTVASTDRLIAESGVSKEAGQVNAARRIALLEEECARLRGECTAAQDELKTLKSKSTQPTPGESIRVVLGAEEERLKVGGKGWECKVLGTLHFGYQRHEVILVIRDPNYASELLATVELGEVAILSSSLRTYCRYEGQCAKLYGDAASVDSEEPSYIACFRFKVEGTDELTSQS